MDNDEAIYRLSCELFRIGIVAPPIVYPVVPKGSARLRLCATAAQDEEFLQKIVKGFEKVRSRL